MADLPESLQRALERSAEARTFYADAPTRFFDAWREGVELAGFRYFGDGTRAAWQRARSIDVLRPQLDFIEAALPPLSPAEQVFLVALVTFYNDAAALRLAQLAGLTSLLDVRLLDLPRRRVLAALMLNYTGW